MKETSEFKPKVERLTEHLLKVARERNFETSPESLREIEDYVRQELRTYGYTVREERFSFAGETFSNLAACLEETAKAPRLIVGAHFDSVSGSPGADDNASGVAALLETARICALLRRQASGAWNSKAPHVEFVAFNLEEYGMIGSQTYARKLKEESVPVIGMLSLEMIGYTSLEKSSQKMPFFLKPFYPDLGNFIGLVANLKSKAWLKRVEKVFRAVPGLLTESLVLPANGWIFPEARLSDHSPFWDEGFPALLVTDTSFFRNPYYHSAEDRMETLDLEFLVRVTEATLQTILTEVLGGNEDIKK